MTPQFKKTITFTLRWGIAVLGITWVLAKTSFHDRVMILDFYPKPNEHEVRSVRQVRVVDGTPDTAPVFINPLSHHPIPRDKVWTHAEPASAVVRTAEAGTEKVKVVAVLPQLPPGPNQVPRQLLIEHLQTKKLERVDPSQVEGGYRVRAPYPLIDIGLFRLVRNANPWYLLLAVGVLPISYLITSRRWHWLLEALDIHMGQGRTFVLNMVGSFYNTFMPGSTGGDIVKAYYAARHTTHRTWAILSVIVDRVVGLLALIILGGALASVQWDNPECRKVAIASVVILAMTALGLFVFYHPGLRKASGLDWLLRRLPMQKQVHKAVEAMEMYGRRPGVMLGALVMTFPVHMTTIVSATFAGKAFGLPLHPLYYWAIVPVVTLVGAIPISPQGVGVMEPLMVSLTRPQGVTVSQAFALVMAIRVAQMFWNLVASIFVLRGGYHAPTEKEQETLESDEQAPAATEGVLVKSE
jgi:uncharacterized protein (TIRG00374 family)